MAPRTDRPPAGWLWIAAAGLAATLAGLAWDAAMHTHNPELAAEESVFTLSNPSHALFVTGLALTVLGVTAALATLARPLPLRIPMGAGALAVVLVAGGLGAWASVSTDEQPHPAAVGEEEEPGLGHDHRSGAGVPAATPEQRAAAQALLDGTIAATSAFRDRAVAEEAGYRFGMVDVEEKLIYHIPNPLYRRDGSILDPEHPESLLYARNPADDSLVLVGVVFRMEDVGVAGPTIGGPITAWHNHSHCLDPAMRVEVSKPMSGSCPDGTVLHTGADMMHVWFADDLATAFSRGRPSVRTLIEYQRRLAAG